MARKSKATPMVLTAFTRGGLASLLHTYTTKLGCSVLKTAEELKDGTQRWSATITAPDLTLEFDKK